MPLSSAARRRPGRARRPPEADGAGQPGGARPVPFQASWGYLCQCRFKPGATPESGARQCD
eukprot:763397-Hanusia_phi.AAC.1